MAKRLFDIVFSSCALLFGIPLFLACTIAVKFSSPGPVFYASPRIGRRGTLFRCWKFRTMFCDAEAKLQVLLASNHSLMEEWRTFYKLKEDPRVTSLGKWLRKTSLDELPQFWNVLKGEMSIVGPRPLSENEVRDYLGEKAAKILSLRPGLTSIWTVSGRNLLTYEERIALEESYVDQQTFRLDCFLILKTILTMILPKGAY